MKAKEIFEKIESINELKKLVNCVGLSNVTFYFNDNAYDMEEMMTMNEFETKLRETFITDIVDKILSADFTTSCYANTLCGEIEYDIRDKHYVGKVEMFIDVA